MSITELGAIGEFVGAIAVVLTLVYIAVQVKYSKGSLDANTESLEANRKLTLASALDQHDLMFNDVYRMPIENPELATAIIKARNGEQLTEVEALQHRNWVNMALRINQASYQRAKAIEHHALMEYTLHALTQMNMRMPAAREVWKTQLRERAVMLGLDEYVRVADNAVEEEERAAKSAT